MRKRIFTLALAMVMILQTMTPVAGLAKGFTPKQKNMVKVGDVDIKSYPKPSLKIIQEANRRKKQQSQGGKIPGGARLFSSPYFPGQDPADDKKPLIYANVNAVFSTKGLDGGNFDWEGVFGKDQDGKPNKAQIVFEQIDNDTSRRTGVKFFLKVGQDGTYTWSDDQGKPTKLPLYSDELKPFKYEVLLDEDVTDHVKLLTARFFGTEEKYYFGEPDPVTGEIVGEINLDLALQQIASTKFTSKWNTGVVEADRPTVEGSFLPGNETDPEMYGIFKFPSNDTEKTIIRNDQLDPNNPGEYSEYRATELDKTPTVDVADPDPDATDTYTIDRDINKISYNGKTYKYQVDYDVIDGGKLTMTEILPVTFDANDGKFENFTAPDTETKIVEEVEYESDAVEPDSPTKEGYSFIGWGEDADATTPVSADAFKGIKEAKTFYAIFTKDIIEQDGEDKPKDVPAGHVKVTVELTDKAQLSGGEKQTRIFWVDPKKEVTLPVTKPTGKDVPVSETNSKAYTWMFTKWTSNEAAPRTWSDGITATFPKETTITANYDKSITDQGSVLAKEITVHESFKDEETWVNKFIPEADTLKAAVKVKDANGNEGNLPEGANVELVDDGGAPYADEAALTNALYEKLKEKDNPNDEPTRVETVKAKVTFKNGEVQMVDIPIKVIKNIYEAKTETKPPYYVPKDYVKVTLDPTNKAQDPQKTYYYVNKDAQVVIPGKDPVGTEGNNFVNWTMKTDSAPPDAKGDVYTLANRNKFAEASTITAQYVDNVVEQEGKDKPNVPDDFVKVIVDTTEKASNETRFRKTFWVKKKTPVRIKVDNPVAANAAEAFSKWKQEVEPHRFQIINLNEEHKFSEQETLIKAFYIGLAIEQKEGESKPDTVPDNFIKVFFYTTDKANKEKIYTWWLAPNNDSVIFALESPVGKEVKDGAGNILYKWKFENLWKSKANEARLDDEVGGTPIYKVDTTKVSNGEIFYAQYTTSNVIPYDPANPIDQPEGYVNVTFKAETGLSLKDTKAYYVKKNAGVTLKTIKDDTTGFGYPTVEEKAGYAFDTWDPAEDTEIEDRDIVVTAKAKPVSDVIEKKDGVDQPQGYVEVKFVPTDKATDQKERTFWVNPEKEVTIPVTDPKGTTYYTFNEWRIGVKADGDVYEPTVAKKFTENTIITATYHKAKDIIHYDPKEPITRPDGYVRVTFEAEEGISLSNVEAYYVKKGAKITLGNPKIAKPATEAKTGYEFKGWDKEDSLVLGDADVVVKALANTLPDTIVKKDGEQKPDGYVEVKFVAGENGTVEEKAYYVNPNKYVTLTPPAAKGNTGYAFGSWSPDASIPTVYDKDTTITASFNGLKDVIPNKNPDGTENQKPDGYKTVTFVIDPATGGKIVDKEITTYYVNPAKDVTVPQPKTIADTGYVFEKWDQDTVTTAKKYTEDTTVKGNFKKLDDIIPSTDGEGNPNAKPDGYITVTFDKGDHGKEITGQTVYYVNPKADPVKTLGNITKPSVTAEIGWKQKAAPDAWDKADTDTITGTQDITVTAQYAPIADIVPGDEPKPEGYITVTFENGDHGTLEGTTVYYVNPNKAVVLKDKAPRVKPDTGYKSAGWDTTIEKAIQYEEGDKITALYNKLGDISETEVDGYVKVVFNKGASGILEGTQAYWIKPGVEVNIPAPTVKPNVGYKFDKWDKSLTVTAKANDPTYVITATYTDLDTIIPKTKTDDSEKPNGYVTVTFTTDGNGSLEGPTTYFVNPNKEADFTKIAANKAKKPNIGYTEKGGSWNSTEFKKTFSAPTTEFKFSFAKLDDVIPAREGEDRPEGYVTVTLIPTDKATVTTEKSYWVKADTDVTITDEPVGTKVKDANGITYDYTFTGWTATRGTIASWTGANITGKFIQDTEITAKYSLKLVDVMPLPLAKDNVVTPIGETPEANTLIKNKDKLPENTTIKYATGGEPSVDKAGKVTAKVEVKYPNGKTTIVEVPITVVDNVVPQEGKDKPKVPDSYVKVTVDTTDAATPNTKFTKVFWVKPGVEVTIPGILAPTGKEVTEDGVTKTNKFVKWQRQGADPEKFYETEIKDTFTSDTTIVATYEYDKNVEPVGKNNPWIPQGSNPSPKDFIENPYDDNDPNNPNNLPPGTKFEFVPGKEPDTSEPGEGKTTTIKVIYPNGETKEVPVTFRVTGDVVEQPDPDKKPNVPDNFVEVIVKTTDKATEDVTRTFWVNPTKVVTINVADPKGKDLGDKKYVFTGWDNSLRDQFTKKTEITAKYQEYAYDPDVITGVVATDLKVQPPLKDYADEIHSKEPFTVLRVVTQPDVSEPGMKMAKVEIQFENGVKKIVDIRVYVKPDPKIIEKPVPGDCNNSCDQPNVGKDALNTTDHYQYLIGYPDGNFGPNKGMTRAEAATMFTRLLRQRPVKGQRYNAGLNDIHAGDWYANTVGYAVQRGIVSGYPDGSFKPNKPITRAEFAAIASRFDALAQGNDIAFSDLAPSHWGYNAIRSAATKGWISGYPDNTFRPEQAITRAEVTAITNRMLNRHADLYWIDAHRGEVIRFGDVKRGDWYFEPIMEATMGHDFIRDRDKKTEHWTGLNGKSFI